MLTRKKMQSHVFPNVSGKVWKCAIVLRSARNGRRRKTWRMFDQLNKSENEEKQNKKVKRIWIKNGKNEFRGYCHHALWTKLQNKQWNQIKKQTKLSAWLRQNSSGRRNQRKIGCRLVRNCFNSNRSQKCCFKNVPFQASGHQSEHRCKHEQRLQILKSRARPIVKQIQMGRSRQFDQFAGQNEHADQ